MSGSVILRWGFVWLSVLVLYGAGQLAHADSKVVASIKPLHSLLSAVMQGVARPGLIVGDGGSPHTYALKPSQAAMLGNAHLVFWIGESLETFLRKPIATIATKAMSVQLIKAAGVTRLMFRGRKTVGMKGSNGDTRSLEVKHDHGEEGGLSGHGHQRSTVDPHIWLDPKNAIALVRAIERSLVKTYPDNASLFRSNAADVMKKLEALMIEVASMLKPVKDQRFIVFHDAYQYFEKRFGIAAAGSVTVSPEVIPGAGRLRELKAKVRELNAVCVFAEPQFDPKLILVVTEGTQARFRIIDPLGERLKAGPELYFSLIRNMASTVRDCLLGIS